MACTVHTRDQIVGSEDKNLTAHVIVLFFPYSLWFLSHKRGFSLQNWIRTRNVETLHPVSTVSASLSASFSVILKQGAMEAGF